MISNNNPKFSFRDVLLSTGEYTKEAVIKFEKTEVYESASVGLTLGLREASLVTGGNKGDYSSLLNPDVFNLTQDVFDNTVASTFDSQISTALSMAFLRYLAVKENFGKDELYKFISQIYNKKSAFPNIIFNILNGGRHAGNELDFCEFMIIPKGLDTQDNIKIASEIYLDLRKVIETELGKEHALVGVEGGFSPNISDPEFAINLIIQAINKRNKGKCGIAIDMAANNFTETPQNRDGSFEYKINGSIYSTDSLLTYYESLLSKFPEIIYLEDPFHENDIEGWRNLTSKFNKAIFIVADDLTVTNILYLEKYKGCFNSCVLKINQVGCVTEMMKAYDFCMVNNINTIISQRSRETDSDIVSHLAVGLGSNYIKAGAPARERIIKYNTLIRLWDNVNNSL